MEPAETDVLSSESRAIPSRRIIVHDPGQLPIDYSTTPGGTIFSTTPGGTRIIYERKFLLELRNSPLSRTPPRNLPLIPGVTCDGKVKPESRKDNGVVATETENDKNDHAAPMQIVAMLEWLAREEHPFNSEHEEPQFQMDI